MSFYTPQEELLNCDDGLRLPTRPQLVPVSCDHIACSACTYGRQVVVKTIELAVSVPVSGPETSED